MTHRRSTGWPRADRRATPIAQPFPPPRRTWLRTYPLRSFSRIAPATRENDIETKPRDERRRIGATRTATITTPAPRRSAPYDEEPGFYEPAGLWLYGNARLLRARLFHVEAALGGHPRSEEELRRIGTEAEERMLEGGALVCGVHSPAHRAAAAVPLRWGSPRIVALSGGFALHLGEDLADEPFPEAQPWRNGWDAGTDLAVFRRAPDQPVRYGTHNPGVARLIRGLVAAGREAAPTYSDPFGLARLRSA